MEVVLLSYPRSGNTIHRYFLEYVLSIPSYGYVDVYVPGSKDHILESPILKTVIPSYAYKNNGIIKKIHGHFKDDFNISTNAHLILVVRNPFECLPRHGNMTDELYFDDIDFFNRFSGEKTLLYYEDMLTVDSYWKDLCIRIGGDENQLMSFLSNLDVHKTNCKKFYGACESDFTAAYHIKRLSCEQMSLMGTWIKTHQCHITDRYKHYFPHNKQ